MQPNSGKQPNDRESAYHERSPTSVHPKRNFGGMAQGLLKSRLSRNHPRVFKSIVRVRVYKEDRQTWGHEVAEETK